MVSESSTAVASNPTNLTGGTRETLQRAIAFHRMGDLAQALALYEEILAVDPRHFDALHLSGVIAGQTRNSARAVELITRAIAVDPQIAYAYCNRGSARGDLGQPAAALEDFNHAISLDTSYADAYANRAKVLTETGQLEEALADYDRAIALRPHSAQAHSGRGVALQQLNRIADTIDSQNRAIAIDPQYARAYLNRAFARLAAGDFASGWADYEWRWKVDNAALASERRRFSQPLWLGESSIDGRAILLYGEQGLGDIVQFSRYAKLVSARGARVVLEVLSPLKGLLQSLEGCDSVIARGDPLPEFQFQCPLMSLPLAFRTTLLTIPAEVPYIQCREDLVYAWRERLGARRKLRVGLVWSGGFRPNQPEVWSVDRRRNIPLAQFAVLKHPDVDFYSLQKGQPAESELTDAVANQWDGPILQDFSAELRDFADTAALIQNLDLVISVDTSTAHIAGALGKPVWILSRFDSCWRWLQDRIDSPWYPTARLYRQDRPGDWDAVLRRVRTDLAGVVAQ